jgi:predicted DCC family thiol-disulfide oxidoreductase YuxK
VSGRALLIYEGDCGFCNRCVRFISRRMPSRAELKPWQRVDLDAYGIPRSRARHEVLWVGTDGRVDGGAQAIARLLLDCGGIWALLGGLIRVPPLRWVAHGLYRLVANNRDRMPGGGPTCATDPPRTEKIPPD